MKEKLTQELWYLSDLTSQLFAYYLHSFQWDFMFFLTNIRSSWDMQLI